MTSRHRLSRLAPPMMILLALFALTVQGCFHSSSGGGGGGTPNADPAGYYDSGDVQGGSVAVNDLQAMVTGNRIMMMSVANELLYDGTITGINGNDFTATFTIYTSGETPIAATAIGTITGDSTITGTLTGSGVGSGQFSLLYASTNDQAAAVVSAWRGAGGGFDVFGFTVDDAGNLTHDRSAGLLPFDTCKMKGMTNSVTGTRLYSVNVELTGCFNPAVNGSYTGLATTRDENTTGIRLVYAVSNDSYTLSGEFNPD